MPLLDSLLSVSFLGSNVLISMNVYLFAIIFVLALVWKMLVGRGGGRHY